MKKFKIAYFVSHPIQYQAPLLRYLEEHSEIDVNVFFFSDFSVKSYKDAGFGGIAVQWDVPLLEGYRWKFLPRIGKNHPIASISPFCYGIFDHLRKGKFDAVWLHGWAQISSMNAFITAKILGIPVLLRSEAQEGSALRHPLTRLPKEVLLRRILSGANACLPIGTRNRNYYLKYGLNENMLFDVPYTVDNNFFQKNVSTAQTHREILRQSLQLKSGRKIILFASKLVTRKRAKDLLEAYMKMSSDQVSEPDPYLIFVGDGEHREELEARAQSTGWSSIRFLGFKNQTELPAYFDLCDIFVLPSENEPWGLIVNEVMNAGKPVIVTDGVGAADDLVIHRENGYIYPVGDIDALKNILQSLIADPERMRQMGEASLRIINNWSFREDVEGLERALEYVTTKKK